MPCKNYQWLRSSCITLAPFLYTHNLTITWQDMSDWIPTQLGPFLINKLFTRYVRTVLLPTRWTGESAVPYCRAL
jgi:hypothetical protein